jgi:stage II sporulation protein P
MKNKKIIIVRFLYVSVWLIISILCIYVFLKAYSVFASEDLRQTFGELGKEITLDIGLSVVNASSPVVKYEESNNIEDSVNRNTIFYRIMSIFPINQYVMTDIIKGGYNADKDSFYDLFKDTYLASNFSDELGITHLASSGNDEITGDVSLISQDSYYETEEPTNVEEDSIATSANSITYSLKQLSDYSFLKSTFYIGEGAAYLTKDDLNASQLLKKDMTIKVNPEKPQILIYHTHSQEAFADSKSGSEDDTVVGVGERLADILENTYGIKVIHDTTKYDIVDGQVDRSYAYNVVAEKVPTILKKNPSIEVLIDLHRDEGSKRAVTINGVKMAQVMFFNGLSRNSHGPIEYLYNPNLENNLAFSLQMKIKADEIFPNFTKKIYLKGLRYNLNLKPKSLLIELGTNQNTVEEAKNAMEPLAKILYEVLTGNSNESGDSDE